MHWLIPVLWLIPTIVTAEMDCPISFDEFLVKFELASEFQQLNTMYPLKHSFVDLAAEPEPKVVENPLSQSEVSKRNNPIYPSPTHQKETRLVREIKSVSPERSAVSLRKPDTGYVLIYYFEKIKGCWKLVEFEDASM